MLFRLATTFAGGEDAAARGAGATFSIEAAPPAPDAATGVAIGAAATTGSIDFTGRTGDWAGACTVMAGTAVENVPLDCIPAFAAKYTTTTPIANADIHNTRFNGVASRARESRRGVPSMVAKMLGPKSGCRDLLGLLVPGSPNN